MLRRGADLPLRHRSPTLFEMRMDQEMTNEEQLEKWVSGESVHTTKTKECVPDFSCCHPYLLAPEAVRRSFVAADAKERGRFLSFFLSAFLDYRVNGRVTIISDSIPE